jgi:hypothetical protein
MSGISYLVDEHGSKSAVVIDLKRHQQLWEDFYDAVVSHQRQTEPRERLAAVKRKLARRCRDN